MKKILYKLIVTFFKKAGFKLNKIQVKSSSTAFRYDIQNLINEPLNKDYHFDLASQAFKNKDFFLAFAEIKTANFIDSDSKKINNLMLKIKNHLPKLTLMRHNLYFRYLTLANEIKRKDGYPNLSILDIGGGEGCLSAFIPDLKYCLVEPTKNGISGLKIPFPEKSFDYVVSCHVLEHIEPDRREDFLNNLLRQAKKGIILLNPFYVKKTFARQRLELIIKLTDSKWAKEHLDLNLPTIGFIEEFVKKKGLTMVSKENGNFMLTMTSFFLDHYANKSGSNKDLLEINSFYNKNFSNLIHKKENFPTDFLVSISLECEK